jgi:hypothetical protein
VSANGGRVRFFRDIANVTMDLDDLETVDFNALGGADDVVVGDLSGTDVIEVNANLAMFGSGDGQPDDVVLHGTNDDDVSLVVGDAAGVTALGLAARVNITGAEAANDRLTVNALAGDDVVEASGLAAGAIQVSSTTRPCSTSAASSGRFPTPTWGSSRREPSGCRRQNFGSGAGRSTRRGTVLDEARSRAEDGDPVALRRPHRGALDCYPCAPVVVVPDRSDAAEELVRRDDHEDKNHDRRRHDDPDGAVGVLVAGERGIALSP